MASGSFARPLPDPTAERSLLELSGIKAMQYTQAASTTRNLVFPSESKAGLLILASGNSAKHGLYLFGETTSGTISLTPIVTPTQSGLSVTVSSHTITIVNGSAGLYVTVLAFLGALPSVVTPT